MTDPTPAPPLSTGDKLKAFLLSPMVQEPLKSAFAVSGPAYLWLVAHGQNAQQIAWEYQMLILFGPGAVVWVFNQIRSTKASIVNQAAKIIAAKNGEGTPAVEKAAGAMVKAVSTLPGVDVAVDTKVAAPAVTAVAMDKNVDHVNPV